MAGKFSALPDGSCFLSRGRLRKKIDSSTHTSRGADGRFRKRKVRGDPEVRRVGCPLDHLGIGLPGPDQVLELGRRRRPCR
jgi:hypothetical protein